MERLLRLMTSGPDPDGAPARLRAFLEAAGSPAAIPDEAAERLLCVIVAQSPALARTLAQDPRRLAALAADPHLHRAKPRPVMRAEAETAVTVAGDLLAGLRRSCKGEMLRLGARELGFGPAEEVAAELAHLAGACLDVAIAAAAAELDRTVGEPRTSDGGRCRFVVFGMGKLGGEELNFSSDIDLIFAYETDAGAAGEVTLHQYFTKLAGRVARAIDELTVDGRCFRVDLRLRPEGTTGAICNSLPAMERYYETFGRAWERQAWIKARPVAGDLDLGDEVLRTLEPFIWPRVSLGGATSVGAVQEMLRLLGQARAQLGTDEVADDVKLGPGSIREVEFFVQALQLVHGGRQPALRERNTLRALDRLLFAGLISEREHRSLGDGYVFLRRLEHRLQLDELRQTHRLPERGEKRDLLARRLGHADGAALDEALAAQRTHVGEVFHTLGALAEPTTATDEAVAPEIALLTDRRASDEARAAALRTLGFRDVDGAVESLALLLRRPQSPFAPSASGAEARLPPLILAEVAASPDPDLALRRLLDLAGRRGAAAEVWRFIETGGRPLARLLMSLFGTSDYLAKIFVAHPELIAPLLAAPRGARARDLPAHRRLLAERRAAIAADDEEGLLNALRRYRHEELLRIGLYDVAGELDVEEVADQLSLLAEACIEATLAAVLPAIRRRWPDLSPSLSVLGLGKLGARELSYSSDLDLIFVFGGDGDSPDRFERVSRLAQRFIRGLDAYLDEGRLYEVDTRLRPSGQRGALVSSLEGFRAYHEKGAAPWERQALIKLRAVAGDAAVGAAVEEIAADQVWRGAPLDPAATAAEIVRLRDRMERELAREAPAEGRYNLKAGRGGLVDIEFVAQYLQLLFGPADPSLRARATRPALDALHAAGRLGDEDHARLIAAYRFLRRLEARLRIVHDRSIAELSDDGRGELDKLARRLSYRGAAAGARLLDEYRDQTDGVRAIYRRLLG